MGLDKLSPDRHGSRVKVSSASQDESSARKSPASNQRHSDGSHQHGMETCFRERASNTAQCRHNGNAPTPQQGVQLGELGVGSAVQVSDPPRYGVVRWIGELPNIQGIMAGVELVS